MEGSNCFWIPNRKNEDEETPKDRHSLRVSWYMETFSPREGRFASRSGVCFRCPRRSCFQRSLPLLGMKEAHRADRGLSVLKLTVKTWMMRRLEEGDWVWDQWSQHLPYAWH